MRITAAVLLSSCFLFTAGRASADTLLVTQTATGSGVFRSPNGQYTSFTDVPIVRTYSGDASTTYVGPTNSVNFNGAVSVTIGDFGTVTALSAPPSPYYYGFRPYGFEAFIGATGAGIGQYTQSADGTGDFTYTTLNPSLAEYNLASSFGPITGTFTYYAGGFFANIPDEYSIDGGTLDINSFGPTSTYQATIVSTTPEPSTLVLLGTGLLGTVAAARRRYA